MHMKDEDFGNFCLNVNKKMTQETLNEYMLAELNALKGMSPSSSLTPSSFVSLILDQNENVLKKTIPSTFFASELQSMS